MEGNRDRSKMKTSETVKEKYYVNSKIFREQLEVYYYDDKMTDELAMNIIKIAEGLSHNWRFLNYTKSWKEDMVGDATIKMYAALESKKFRLASEFNPFSYFNRIAWNAFSNRIKKENKQHAGLQEYKQMVYEDILNDPNTSGNVYVRPIMDSEGGEHDE